MNAVPLSLKRAIGVGIGLFILFIGFANGGLINWRAVGVPARRLVAFPTEPAQWVFLAGLLITVVLYVMQHQGRPGDQHPAHHDPRAPRRAWRRSRDQADRDPEIRHARTVRPRPGLQRRCRSSRRCSTIFAIMLTDFFDTMGTVTGVAAEAGLTERGRLGAGRRPRPAGRLAGRGRGWCGGRQLQHDVHRERGGRRGRRPNRLHLGRHRRAVPARHPPVADRAASSRRRRPRRPSCWSAT